MFYRLYNLVSLLCNLNGFIVIYRALLPLTSQTLGNHQQFNYMLGNKMMIRYNKKFIVMFGLWVVSISVVIELNFSYQDQN